MTLRSITFILSLFILVSCSNKVNGQIAIYYKDNQDKRVNLENESYYDIEQKPTIFFIEDYNSQTKGIYIIEVYRIIPTEGKAHNHFYKSFSLTTSELSNGFDLKGIFDEVTSPFIQTGGFIINVCKTNKTTYLKLKDKDQCLSNAEFRVLSGR